MRPPREGAKYRAGAKHYELTSIAAALELLVID
jgi:hypothetical protein